MRTRPKRLGPSFLLLLGLLFLCESLQAEIFRGRLFRDNDTVHMTILDKERKETYPLVLADKSLHYTLDEVFTSGKEYFFEIEGEIEGNRVVAKKTPTIIGDIVQKRGLLRSSNSVTGYSLEDTPAAFGRTKSVYLTHFDQKSIESFLGEEVVTQGHFEKREGEDVFLINAIMPDYILSASEDNLYPAPKEFEAQPEEFILDEMPKNKWAQGQNMFRGTIYETQESEVSPGDAFVLITLSGRQGDTPGASAGHFAIGMGEVQKDMSLKGETFNFYFKGEKEVLAGHTNLINYYGHLIQGQLNYRPTFTLVAYGKSKKELMKVRHIFEEQLHRVRTEGGLEITPQYNCTTTSNKALREIGIYGKHRNFLPATFDLQNLAWVNPLSWFPSPNEEDNLYGDIRTLSYIARKDKQEFIPRSAFEAFVKNFDDEKRMERMGLHRADYFFIPQTPSQRQVGGMSYDTLKEGKKVIDFSEKWDKRWKELFEAEKLINRGSAADSEISQAQALIDRLSPDFFQEQVQVIRPFLNKLD